MDKKKRTIIASILFVLVAAIVSYFIYFSYLMAKVSDSISKGLPIDDELISNVTNRILPAAALQYIFDDQDLATDSELKNVLEFSKSHQGEIYNVALIKLSLSDHYIKNNKIPNTLDEISSIIESTCASQEVLGEKRMILGLKSEKYYYRKLNDDWVAIGPKFDEITTLKMNERLTGIMVDESKLIIAGENYIIIFQVKKIKNKLFAD